jgi:pimeloyl-ACP methyl ester carboxylesterase
VGIWAGSLSIPNNPAQRLALEVKNRADGALAADLIFLDDGASGTPSSSVHFSDGVLRVETRRPSLVIEGALRVDGQELDAQFRAGSITGVLPLRRVDHMPGLARRWQNPVRPYPYREEDVTYPGGAPGETLAGTLVMPPTGGPFPAVVLVTGSGPQSRDELVEYHRPFLVLADHLVRRGIAVLRYDDRGVGESTGAFDQATTADLADDAAASLAYLRGRAEIDPGRVGIIGHSEGGMIAPMVAARSSEVAFIVLLAGPGVPLDELLVTQMGQFAVADGATERQVAALLAMYRVIHRAVATETDRNAVYTAIGAYYNGLTATEKVDLGWPRSRLNAEIETRLAPWWRYCLAFDPAVYLEQVRCPVLAVNGDHDLNVAAAENLAAIDRALTRAGNTDYRVVQLPGINHGLNGNGRTEPSDTTQAIETVSPGLLDLVSSWTREHVGLPPNGTAVEALATMAPQAFLLAQNYPNPFNSTTVVRFTLPASASVDLGIYDMAGQRVAQLVSDHRGPGTYAVRWEGLDASGRQMASGVYLARLESVGKVHVRKLTLLR